MINFKSTRATKHPKIPSTFCFCALVPPDRRHSQTRQYVRTMPRLSRRHYMDRTSSASIQTRRNRMHVHSTAYRRQQEPQQQASEGPIGVSCLLSAFSVRVCCLCCLCFLCCRTSMLSVLSVRSCFLCFRACFPPFCASVRAFMHECFLCFRNRPLFCAGTGGTGPAPTPTTHPTNTGLAWSTSNESTSTHTRLLRFRSHRRIANWEDLVTPFGLANAAILLVVQG